ncbi:MAG: hypothetical protein ACRD20_19520 [Terriglobales bacterium]
MTVYENYVTYARNLGIEPLPEERWELLTNSGFLAGGVVGTYPRLDVARKGKEKAERIVSVIDGKPGCELW